MLRRGQPVEPKVGIDVCQSCKHEAYIKYMQKIGEWPTEHKHTGRWE